MNQNRYKYIQFNFLVIVNVMVHIDCNIKIKGGGLEI